MDFEEKINFIKEHILGSIERYIIGDLIALDEIQPDEEGRNGCAIPTAMYILSAIEFIGFIVAKDNKIGNSEANIGAAFNYKNYFPDIYRENSEKLVKVYRHGMMHSVFPKHTFKEDYFAICKCESQEQFYEKYGTYHPNLGCVGE